MPPFSHELGIPISCVPVMPRQMSAGEEIAARVLDIVISLAALVLLSPVILALTIMIRRNSEGPAIFKQKRLGEDLEPFTFYKFRTLYVDARERFPELYAYDYSVDEVRTMRFKIDDDPRLTSVGAWLRKTSLDELPNLYNVLKGDMTLVGPRPEIPEMFKYYEEWQRAKWQVKPGVTGFAQTQGRGYLTLQETIYWDIRFVCERSLMTYVRVLGRTAWTVGQGIGAF